MACVGTKTVMSSPCGHVHVLCLLCAIECLLRTPSSRLNMHFSGALQRKAGEAKLEQLCKDGELHAEKFLAADPEFDAPETPDVAAFLKQEGLSAVPL